LEEVFIEIGKEEERAKIADKKDNTDEAITDAEAVDTMEEES